MKKIVITIIMFAIAIALIVGVIVPIATQAHATGQGVMTRQDTLDSDIDSLAREVT